MAAPRGTCPSRAAILGWPESASHPVFYNLDKLKSGDEVVLKVRGRDSFMAGRILGERGQAPNRDVLTLQPCIPPTFEDRPLGFQTSLTAV